MARKLPKIRSQSGERAARKKNHDLLKRATSKLHRAKSTDHKIRSTSTQLCLATQALTAQACRPDPAKHSKSTTRRRAAPTTSTSPSRPSHPSGPSRQTLSRPAPPAGRKAHARQQAPLLLYDPIARTRLAHCANENHPFTASSHEGCEGQGSCLSQSLPIRLRVPRVRLSPLVVRVCFLAQPCFSVFRRCCWAPPSRLFAASPSV
jgi:hypothetical protein